MYRQLIRPLLFRSDPESAHEATMRLLSLCNYQPLRALLEALYSRSYPQLAVSVGGLSLKNPFMLAAGLDKYGTALPALAALGFSAIEVGTVTPQAQPGNPRPRIFRLAQDRALINRMGFPSQGAAALATVLRSLRAKLVGVQLGINIGKNKEVALEDAHRDYQHCFEALYDLGDYFTINVSSPNTPNLRKLQDRDKLELIIETLRLRNRLSKPLFLKISPDLEQPQLAEVVELCMQKELSGIIATNTTLAREGLISAVEEQGGLSGQPLYRRALATVANIRELSAGKLPIIGVGGISSIGQVVAMLNAGASAVQIYTGLVYEGPGLVKQLCRQLSALGLDRGHKNREFSSN